MPKLLVRLAVVIDAQNPSSKEAAIEALKVLNAAPVNGDPYNDELLEGYVEEVEDWEGESEEE